MTITCNACGEETPHFKGLIDHYKEKHPTLLKWYEIKHPHSKTRMLIESPDPESAIEAQGWKVEQCIVRGL